MEAAAVEGAMAAEAAMAVTGATTEATVEAATVKGAMAAEAAMAEAQRWSGTCRRTAC